ncbi:hypothetical protein CEXT_597591 [Caerostris extrusa]|uniref:Uncharacterized protein n=1 Tax=Caerostris extrusa TaxID=172846 RepID=A0AAV4R0B2_CAEEX|nr:hypothetical protein CEXT_597591 [Caerostris extrusa]
MIQIQRKDIKIRKVMRKTKNKYRRDELRKMVLVQNTMKKWQEQHIDNSQPGRRIQRNEPVRNRCNPTIAPMPNQRNQLLHQISAIQLVYLYQINAMWLLMNLTMKVKSSLSSNQFQFLNNS